MKRVILFAALALLTSACGSSRKAASSNQQQNYIADGAQQVVEEYKAQGYSPYGSYSMFTMYELVSKARNKILEAPDRNIPIQGIGEGNDLASSRLMALSNAAVAYATQAGSTISGKMVTQFSNLTEKTRTKIAGAYEQKVSEYIMPTLTENYIIGKREGNNIVVLANYMIDEVKAKEIRERAIDEVVDSIAKEVSLEQAFMDSASQLVGDQPIQ